MIKNLIGQKFNYLEVIDGPIIQNKKTYWKCRCECGNEKIIRSDGLKSGATKSCGCYKNNILIEGNKKRQTLDLTNQRFGKLIALAPTSKRNVDGRVIWQCQCDCGEQIEVDTHSLQQNRVQSCGCLRSKGELIIASLLKEANINFEQQKSFKDCKFPNSNYYAKFDFYVNNQYIIEYDGEQHYYYKNNPHTWNNKTNFEIVQQHDKYKNNWCKEHQIPIIRIPYFKLQEITINDLLLDSSQYII